MENLKRIILILFLVSCRIDTMKAQTPRVMRYFPDGQDIVCLNGHKNLKSMTIRTLSNDVVIGLMAVTLER